MKNQEKLEKLYPKGIDNAETGEPGYYMDEKNFKTIRTENINYEVWWAASEWTDDWVVDEWEHVWHHFNNKPLVLKTALKNCFVYANARDFLVRHALEILMAPFVKILKVLWNSIRFLAILPFALVYAFLLPFTELKTRRNKNNLPICL